MKSLKLCGGGIALALLVFGACNHTEPEIDVEPVYDDAYWAALASVSSTDPSFTSTDEGGTITFKTEGGEVVISVDCGTAWSVENHAADVFDVSQNTSAQTVTVTASQNYEENDLETTISFLTDTARIEFATVTILQSAYNAPEISVETAEWHAPAVGALTTEIAVDASADWTAESDGEWLTVAKTDASLSLTAAENEATEERSCKVTLNCTDGYRTTTEYISVTQDAKAYLTVSEESLSFQWAEDSAEVTVESNFDWDFSYDSEGNWFSVERSGDTVTVTVSENDKEEGREGTVTFTAGDGAENVAEVQLTISQELQSAPLVLTYSITTDTTIELPFSGTIDCLVDWGDGSSENVSSTFPSHTYTSTGDYEVKAYGTVTAISSYVNKTAPAGKNQLTAVKAWGNTGLTDVDYAFYNCTGLVSVPDDANDVFENVPTLTYFFYGCSSLASVGKNVFGNCPNATSLADTFQNCTSLTEIPAGIFDNCPAVTNLTSLFASSSIKALPEGIFDNCPLVTTVNGMCKSCTNLTTIPNGLFDAFTEITTFTSVFYGAGITSIPSGLFKNNTKATTMASAFRGCESLVSVPEGLFDGLTKCTNYTYEFTGDKSLKSIPVGLFADSPLTGLTYTFSECESLEEVPEDVFKGCSKATTATTCFNGCTSLKKIPAGLFKDCTAITNFTYVFKGCSSLEEVPDSVFANCVKATQFKESFSGCTSLKKVPTDLFSDCTKVTTFQGTFSGCSALTGESPYSLVEIELDDETTETVIVHLYERASYTSNFTKPTTTTDCFTGCTGLDDYKSIPSAWGGGGE